MKKIKGTKTSSHGSPTESIPARLDQIQVALLIALSILFFFLNSKTINLSTSDLGRHLMNGKLLLSQAWGVLDTNFYSYSYPAFPFVNHHWATGTLFYLLESWFGFIGLSFLYRVMSLATFLIFFFLAKKQTGFQSAFWAALLAIPVIAYRTEIRPEGFSTLFLGIFIWVLYNWRTSRGKDRSLLLLPFLMLCWVNLHIYFFLGFLVLAAFLLESFLKREINLNRPWLIKIIAFCFAATFVNPLTYRVALFPFFIFENFGYELLENQTAFFFLHRSDLSIPSLPPFFLLLALVWIGCALLLSRNPRKIPLPQFLLGGFFSFFALNSVRNFGLFGYVAIPVLALGWHELPYKWFKRSIRPLQFGTILLSLGIYFWLSYPLPIQDFGFGLRQNVNAAADFLKANHLKGPLLNDYDNGGYLIYHLFPEEKVFVDNRPEAYPESFFKNLYIPLLEQDELWSRYSETMAINLIVFNRFDLTPWGQTFLRKRILDQKWATVFLDNYSIILLRRNSQNESVIRRFEILH